jgi:hypothetical protein
MSDYGFERIVTTKRDEAFVDADLFLIHAGFDVYDHTPIVVCRNAVDGLLDALEIAGTIRSHYHSLRICGCGSKQR